MGMSIKSEVYLRCCYCGKLSCKFCGEVIELPEQDNFPGAFINDPDLEFYVCDACAKIEVLDKDFESDIPYWLDPDDPVFYVCDAYEECEKIEKDFESDIPFWLDPDDPEFYVRDAYDAYEAYEKEKSDLAYEAYGAYDFSYMLDPDEVEEERNYLECCYCGKVSNIPGEPNSEYNDPLNIWVCDACQQDKIEASTNIPYWISQDEIDGDNYEDPIVWLPEEGNLIDWSDPDPDNRDKDDE
jgi:hypothetical protein